MSGDTALDMDAAAAFAQAQPLYPPLHHPSPLTPPQPGSNPDFTFLTLDHTTGIRPLFPGTGAD